MFQASGSSSPNRSLDAQRIAHQLAPLHTLDPLEHDARLARFVLDVVDRHDVRVLEAPEHQRLLQQHARGRVARELGLDALHRHVAIEHALLGQAHDAHAALPDHAPDLDTRAAAAVAQPAG